MKLSFNASTTFFILLCLILQISLAAAEESECEMKGESDDENKPLALRLKIGAIFAILFASFAGVVIPIFGRSYAILAPGSNLFFILKSFAGGVLLAVGLIHILPESFEKLGSPCLPEKPWHLFKFAGFIAMLSAIITLMIDSFASGYLKKSYADNQDKGAADEMINKTDVEGGSDKNNQAAMHTNSQELIRYRVISQVHILIQTRWPNIIFLIMYHLI